MAVKLTVNIKPDFAHFTCVGQFSGAALMAAIEQALEISIQNGRRAALFDISEITGEPPDALERHTIGETFAAIQLAKNEVIAVAVYGREPYIDPERLSETVAINRCAVVKVFTSEEAAIQWLEHTSG